MYAIYFLDDYKIIVEYKFFKNKFDWSKNANMIVKTKAMAGKSIAILIFTLVIAGVKGIMKIL